MDVSELRRKILRAIDEGKPDDRAKRRAEIDTAKAAYDRFLELVAVPLFRQAQTILKAEGRAFVVHAPADGVKLVSDGSPSTFLEFLLDTSSEQPRVIGRVSRTRSRGVTVEEQPLAAGKPVDQLTEEDVAGFFVNEIPKLVRK
ncbi:MAG TPA: hypothetical protein VFV78_01835 [Vicinamibacterales bacterium]|nr:hypothetical protein [Vicinamibacterales bacterium]